MSNLTFGICHVHFITVLAQITAFENELSFSKVLKIGQKRPIEIM